MAVEIPYFNRLTRILLIRPKPKQTKKKKKWGKEKNQRHKWYTKGTKLANKMEEKQKTPPPVKNCTSNAQNLI